jgi:hypothetical protein
MPSDFSQKMQMRAFHESPQKSIDWSSAAGQFKLERESNVIATFFDRENLTYQQLLNRQAV